jgi:hypothetical protein
MKQVLQFHSYRLGAKNEIAIRPRKTTNTSPQ